MAKQLNIDLVVELPLVVPGKTGYLLNSDNFTMLSELPGDVPLDDVNTVQMRVPRFKENVEIDLVPNAFKLATLILEENLLVAQFPINFPPCSCAVRAPSLRTVTRLDEPLMICGGHDVISPMRLPIGIPNAATKDIQFITMQQPTRYDFVDGWVERGPCKIDSSTLSFVRSTDYINAAYSVVFPMYHGERFWCEATINLDTDMLSVSWWLGDTLPKIGILVKRPKFNYYESDEIINP